MISGLLSWMIFTPIIGMAVIMFLPNGIWPALARKMGLGR